jgi:hypothetical protein
MIIYLFITIQYSENHELLIAKGEMNIAIEYLKYVNKK